MWSLFGCLGQLTVNGFAGPRGGNETSFWRSITEGKWSPITYVSNEEYAKILNEQMLKLDVEIAVLNDKIAAARREQQEQKAQSEVKQEKVESKGPQSHK